MKVKESEDDKNYFSNYNPEDLENIISTQSKVILQQKKQKQTAFIVSWSSLMILQMTRASQDIQNYYTVSLREGGIIQSQLL